MTSDHDSTPEYSYYEMSGFVEYLESKPWGIGQRQPYRMIEAADVAASLPHVANVRQAEALAPLAKKATKAKGYVDVRSAVRERA